MNSYKMARIVSFSFTLSHAAGSAVLIMGAHLQLPTSDHDLGI